MMMIMVIVMMMMMMLMMMPMMMMMIVMIVMVVIVIERDEYLDLFQLGMACYDLVYIIVIVPPGDISLYLSLYVCQ